MGIAPKSQLCVRFGCTHVRSWPIILELRFWSWSSSVHVVGYVRMWTTTVAMPWKHDVRHFAILYDWLWLVGSPGWETNGGGEKKEWRHHLRHLAYLPWSSRFWGKSRNSRESRCSSQNIEFRNKPDLVDIIKTVFKTYDTKHIAISRRKIPSFIKITIPTMWERDAIAVAVQRAVNEITPGLCEHS